MSLGGKEDWDVPIINSEQLYFALKMLGVPTGLVVYPNEFHGINTPSNFYGQLENARVVTGSEILTVTPSGHFHPMFQAVASQNPTIEFSTQEIATLLTETGITGVDTSGGNVDFYGKVVTQLGTRTADASLVHERFRVAEAKTVRMSLVAHLRRSSLPASQ